MIDEGQTKVLGRRIIASLIDLGLVGGLTALFARSQSESFQIVERTEAGEAVFAQADADRLATIASGFNRTQEIGDTLYAFKLIDLIFLVVVGLLLILLAKVLIPANTGWSFGQKLLGLKVVNDEGQRPTTSQHFARTIGGVIDLFPYVIPGLLGWFVARSRPFRQRIGDSSAKTTVVSSRVKAVVPPGPLDDIADIEVSPVDSQAHTDLAGAADKPSGLGPDSALPDASLPDAPLADVPLPDTAMPVGGLPDASLPDASLPDADLPDVAMPGASMPDGSLPTAGLAGVALPDTDLPVGDSPADRLRHAAEVADPSPNPTPNFESPPLPTVDDHAIDGQPGDATSLFASRPDIDAPDLGATPEDSPVDLSAIKGAPIVIPEAEPLTRDSEPLDPEPAEPAALETPGEGAGEPLFPTVAARADRPQPMHRTSAERENLFKATTSPAPAQPVDTSAETGSTEATSQIQPEARRKAPPPRHRAARNDWERPVAEPAPVWGPGQSATPVEANTAEANPVEADTADLDLTETGLTSAGPTDSRAEADATAASLGAGAAAASGGDKSKEPQWSDEWDSWLYWDAAKACWLRHDTSTGRWVPIE